MSRSGQADAHRRQQPRGNGHGPRTDHRDQRCALGRDRRELHLQQSGIGPCVTGWPIRRPAFPYTGGRTRQPQRCAAAVGRPGAASRALVH